LDYFEFCYENLVIYLLLLRNSNNKLYISTKFFFYSCMTVSVIVLFSFFGYFYTLLEVLIVQLFLSTFTIILIIIIYIFLKIISIQSPVKKNFLY